MKRNDLSRSLIAFDQATTLVAVVELSRGSWLAAGLVPHLTRQPLKKLRSDPEALLGLVLRWRDQATKAGGRIKRIVVAFEAGRDGFWLARWLRVRGIEAYVIHSASIPVSREHRRAKTDRLDVGLLKRSYLGWLRGEAKHCRMVAVPTREEEDGKRPLREREGLVGEATRLVNRMTSLLALYGVHQFNPRRKRAAERLAQLTTAEGEALPPQMLGELQRGLERLNMIKGQIAAIEAAQRARLATAPAAGPHPMILALAKVVGVGVMTAELLVREVLSRHLRDRRAVARYAGLTGAPDESGKRRREKGLARAGSARVRRAMLQLAWRWLRHQPHCSLAKWFRARTLDGRRDTKLAMIVALARKLLIALWELAVTGKLPEGIRLHRVAA